MPEVQGTHWHNALGRVRDEERPACGTRQVRNLRHDEEPGHQEGGVMPEDNWVSLDSGLVYPPQVQRRAQPVSDELMEAVRQEFDGAITELMESIQPAQRNAGALGVANYENEQSWGCLLYTSPSPRDRQKSRMPSSA